MQHQLALARASRSFDQKEATDNVTEQTSTEQTTVKEPEIKEKTEEQELDDKVAALTFTEEISPKTSKTTVKAGPPEGQKKQTQEVDPDKPFEIRYKPSPGGGHSVWVVITSQNLLSKLQHILGNNSGINLFALNALFPIENFYHSMTKLLARQEAGETISADLRLLMHSAKKSYEKVKVELDALIAKGVMRYDKLWYFLPPGCVVFRSQCGVPMCVILNDCMDTVDPLGRASMQVRCHHIAGGENGMKGMQMHKMCYIRYFSGERNIAELEVYPLKYHADAEGIREGLIKRGREYASFAQNQPYHMQYNGKYYYDDGSIAHHVAMVEGRIMVDWRGFGRYPPGEDGFHGMVRRKQDGGWDELTDDEALICDPAVPGYSLTGNFFGRFAIDCISKIEWDKCASFEKQVKGQDLSKKAITAVTTKSLKGGNRFGYMVALHGPSGVGKTYTVETLAEENQAPLFLFSTNHLDPNELEGALTRAFHLCGSWNAILVMDEADVFLSKRGNLAAQNALVSVFLRLSHTYLGVLFVITNLYDQIDPAVKHRMNMALQYDALDKTQRLELWNAKVSELKCDISAADMEDLAEHSLSGREIVRKLQLAVAPAELEDRPLVKSDIEGAIMIDREEEKHVREDPEDGG